ncbi:hypothetical protein DNTS_020233, partial [Danionella cerebrum]
KSKLKVLIRKRIRLVEFASWIFGGSGTVGEQGARVLRSTAVLENFSWWLQTDYQHEQKARDSLCVPLEHVDRVYGGVSEVPEAEGGVPGGGDHQALS